MSVLIKGIRIPESCAECRFCVNGFTDDAPMYECACQSYDNVSVLVEKDGQPFDFRPEWCPLIELPPHGRLIDADKLMRDIEEYHLSDGKFQHWVEVQQTIIEAEGSET
jgi:hypothetical protein